MVSRYVLLPWSNYDYYYYDDDDNVNNNVVFTVDGMIVAVDATVGMM
jgi:hypothetical protein